MSEKAPDEESAARQPAEQAAVDAREHADARAGAAELTLPAPAAGTRLVLARHGQTTSNVQGRMDTVPPGAPLTEQGQQQARELGERLAGERIAAIHASRALRTQQTAHSVAQRHGLQIEIVDGTQEIYVGQLEGSGEPGDIRRFEDTYANWHFGSIDTPMPGGETGRQALTRFVQATNWIIRRQQAPDLPSGTLLLVSHGAMVRLVAGLLSGNITGEQANANYLRNAGVITLETDPSLATGWRCVHWDDLAG